MFCSKRLFVAILFVLIKIPAALQAQCPVTVNAGPDKFVCNTGNTVDLEGSISGSYIGFRWTPATGLNNATILNPTATVNGTATYTLTGAAVDPNAPNLVNNPGFESGNTGFTSGYTYNPLPVTPGTYVLTTSPALVLSAFPPCDDHTFGNGTGYMMLCNGNGGASTQVWCQSIPVMPNNWYLLSGWVLCSPIAPPILQFRINGTPVGDPYSAQPLGCVWQEFTATWYSGTATNANFCIFNINGSGNGLFGDDFAIDDISMVKACTESDQVTVSVVTVNAVTSPTNVILPCSAAQTGIVLNGSGSSQGPGYTYSWDGPGIVSGENTLTPTVNEPGTYTLTVSFDTGDGICSKQATVTVQPDPLQVNASANALGILSCANATATLSGAGSSVGGLVTYNWQPSSGVVSGGNTLFPSVNQPGVYTLLVTNTVSGCTATATATMGQNLAPATAAAAAPGTLPCIAGTLTLNGAGSSTGANFSYQWNGPGIVSGAATLSNCVVSAPGVYTLVVTNTASGCTASATASVVQSGAAPTVVANAAPPGALNCVTAQLTLNSTGSSNDSIFTYLWTTPNGHFTGPVNGQTATVDSAGTYILTITNTQNGCTATDTVQVSGLFTPPLVSVAQPLATLNCGADSVQIDATASSGGPGFLTLWTTSGGGNILSGDTTLTPWVNAAGNYTLLITDTLNGCTASSSVAVAVDTLPPLANASTVAPGLLNCVTPVLTLTSAGSSSDSTISLVWATPNGHFTGPVNGPTATVDSAGVYILNVVNTQNGCTAADTVSVTGDFVPPVASIAQPVPSITCAADSVQIDASASPGGPGFQVLWTTAGGNLLSGDTTLQPWVGAAGNYSLRITNPANGCTVVVTASVGIDTAAPAVQIAPPAVLDCQTTTLVLDASGSSSGPGFSYQWTFSGPGNGILSGDTTLSPTVNTPGIYTLTAVNTVNNCVASGTATVQQSAVLPAADAGQPQTLLCGVAEVTLDGSASATGPAIQYAWSTPDGNILQGANTLTPSVNAAGAYILTVTDTLTGCSNTAQVQVQQDINAPVADAGQVQYITCLASEVTLNGAGSSAGPSIIYLWTTSDGVILSGDTTVSPLVGAVGTYLLQVTDVSNNCQSLSSVQVLDLTQPPAASAAAPQTLTCALLQMPLDGAGSSTGANMTYQWSGPGIVSDGNTLSPIVDATGTYTLTVTDQTNGCTATASTVASSNTTPPQAAAAAPQTLTCALLQMPLDGAGSSAGANMTYQWSGPGIVSDGNTLSPIVDATGTYTLTVTDQTNGCTATASAVATANTTPPQAVAAAPQTFTCALMQVSLDGAGSSVGANVTYQWSGPGIVSGANTMAPVVNATGTYTFTVTDQTNGCTATASAVATANTAPPQAAAAAPQTLTCALLQMPLDGAGSSAGSNMTYQWSGPGIVSDGNTLSPIVDATGTYTLTVTDQTNGCTATASAVATADTTPPQAVAAAPQTFTCALMQVSLDGAGSSAGANMTYQWSGPGIVSGANTLSPVVNVIGTYTLTVTDQTNGCTATASAVATADTTPPQAVAAAPQTFTCALMQVSLDGAGSSAGANFTYQWSGPGIVSGGNTLSPVVNATGTYTLTVTDQINGCTATASAVATANTTPPQAVAAAPQTFTCALLQISLDGAGSSVGANFTYQWSGPGMVSGGNTLSPIVNATGTYTLTVTNQTNGCTATASVTAVSTSTPPAVDAGAAFTLTCNTPQVTLQGSSSAPGAVFNWSTAGGNIVSGANTPNPTVDAPGLYTLLVTDPATGCTATDTVSVGEGNVVFPAVSSVKPDCNNPTGSIRFSGGAGGQTPFLYSINGGATFSQDSVFDPLQPGVYQAVVQDAGGCEQEWTVDLPAAAPLIIDLDSSLTILAGTKVQLKPALNVPVSKVAVVLWLPDQWLDCAVCLEPIAAPPADVTYTLLVATADGCSDTASVFIRVKPQDNVYVPNAFAPDGAAPNNVFRVFTNIAVRNFELRVFDRWGSLLFEAADVQQGWDGTAGGKALGPGVYGFYCRFEFTNAKGETEEQLLEGGVLLVR